MLCSHCGQPLPTTRLGVRLTPFKARIFDIIRRAGPDGVPSSELQAMVDRNATVLKSHIWQINDVIADAGYRIKGVGLGGTNSDSCYVLRRLK